MKPFYTASVAALCAMCAAAADAQDASCRPLFDAGAKQAAQPYRVAQTMTVGDTVMKSEAVFVEGILYSRSPEMAGGRWHATPIKDTSATAALAKKSTARCRLVGTDTVDGKAMQVWSSWAATQFAPTPVEWKTWIGTADGRPYRQTSTGFDQRIAYDNVIAPEVQTPRKRRSER